MDLGALYEEVILDHNRSPRNWGEVPGGTSVEGRNPLCGDRISLSVRLDGDTIADVRFTGEGCAISKASASMMTQAIKGKTTAEAEALFTGFHDLVTGQAAGSPPDKALGSLRAFAGVARFPTRVKCATMAWHAMREALERSRV
ncbi:MAG: SUF system NifU family Fe-S cluster assembly protein [Gemmatimonadaceae bacterium]|nr:SUF system NifU family Fe-S cluster assembly protein [Gemmatimonadaceae bacterium]